MDTRRDSAGPGAQRPLVLAYSPCPNDTFIFHAWVHGLIKGAPAVEERLEDIDTLNRLALEGDPQKRDRAEGGPDVVKVSIHAFARVRDRYALLHSGGAMGRGCGPLVVAPKNSRLPVAADVRRATALADELGRVRVAVPGGLTTAALLADLFTDGLSRPVIMPFDRIMPAVAEGEVEAGVIIHEGRFTYGSYGLRRLVDLGEWWEDLAGSPLPLGGIAVRRDLDQAVKAQIEPAMRSSVEHALAHPEDAAGYVGEHAQEMDRDVCRQHIELYVNEFTVDYGLEGEGAIRRLLTEAAAAYSEEPASGLGVFWDD